MQWLSSEDAEALTVEDLSGGFPDIVGEPNLDD